MSTRQPLSDDDLEPDVSVAERTLLAAVAVRLMHECPAPRAAFRAQMRVDLRELDAHGVMRSRRAWLWPRVAALGAFGAGVLGLVGLGLAGAGPFAP